MKQRLLKTIALGLLAMVGVNAWAQQADYVGQPTGDCWVGNTVSNVNGEELEMKKYASGSTYFYGVMQFEFDAPQAGYKIKSVSLRTTTRYKKGDSKLNVYGLNAEIADNSIYSSLESAITTALSGAPILSFNVKGDGGKAIHDGGVGDDWLSVDKWQNTIDLTAYVKGLGTNKFAILFQKDYDQDNSTQIYSKEATAKNFRNGTDIAADDLWPQLTVTYEKIYARVTENDVTTDYETLNAAFDGITSNGTITLYNDLTITSRCNIGSKTITVVPAKAGITVSSTLNNSILILGNGGNLTVGSADYQLTIDGGGVTNSSNPVEGSGGTCTFKNVKFYNCATSDDKGIVCHKTDGNLHLENVLFDHCTTKSGRGIVFAGSTGLFIDGTLTFTNCNEYNIYQETGRYLRVGNISSVQAAPITLYNQSPSLKQVVLSSASGGDKSALFQLMNDEFGIIKDPSHNTDHKLTEASEQTITAAGASTLVLPFEAKIPEGVTAYTLTYSGGDAVSATEVTGGTLAANTPVLLNAEAGTYKFVNTALVDAATTGSGTHTTGALTGVYAETTLGTGHYILTKHGDDVGFRKTVASSKVAANRAYLTAATTGARDFLYIDFLDDETTDIMKVSPVSPMSDGIYYDLQGRKVARPVKGMYIVNGKKVIVK